MMAFQGYPQKEKTVGIAFIITNDYKGKYALRGPQFDGDKWEEVLLELRFDVRKKSNLSKDDTIAFLKANTDKRIPIRGPDCHYVIFVFSGHGAKGVLYSQDVKSMSLENDLLPLFFGEGHFRTVPKLIFLDACRSDQKIGHLSLEDSLSKVWKEGMAGYYHLCAAPSGYPALDGDSGSKFSEVVTRLICQGISLPDLQCRTEDELDRHAYKSKTKPIVVDSHSRALGAHSEKDLSKLAKGVSSSHGPGPVSGNTSLGNNVSMNVTNSAVNIGGHNNTTTGAARNVHPVNDPSGICQDCFGCIIL